MVNRKGHSGVLAGQSQLAESVIRVAIGLSKEGKVGEAIACCLKGIAAYPNSCEIHLTLGNVYASKGDNDNALKSYENAIILNPNRPEPRNNMGNILRRQGDIDGAVSCYRKALALNPRHRDALNNLGIALASRGKVDDAIDCYQQAISLDPEYAEAHSNLGNALSSVGRVDEAILAFQKALALKPGNYKTWNNLGGVLRKQGKLTEAISAFDNALRIDPSYAEALNNMAGTMLKQGKVSEAIGIYREAVRMAPNDATAYSNLLLASNYLDGDPEGLFGEHRRWGMVQPVSLKEKTRPIRIVGRTDRKLLIGYVSPDFRNHSVAYFLDGILEGHDRTRFEIFCYSDVIFPDEVTRRFSGMADHFQNIAGMGNDVVANLICHDHIDILVDLAGHTAGKRMPLFTMKPAPIQVSYLGYPNTTGLMTMDYRLTDDLADPSGLTESLYTEELVRLPRSFLCYTPHSGAPEIGNMPDTNSGEIVFGSFNNRAKITPGVVAAWSNILKEIPNGRMILKSGAFADTEARNMLLSLFAKNGIYGRQIELVGYLPSNYEHLQLYNRVHIGLDTFPYNGTTTTCEALWMGVPVVVLAGREHRSRVGVSILTNVGLDDLIAESVEDYVEKAIELGKDTVRLSSIKMELRDQMMRSPLMDREGFVRLLEKAYRWMFDKRMEAQDTVPS